MEYLFSVSYPNLRTLYVYMNYYSLSLNMMVTMLQLKGNTNVCVGQKST